MIRHFVLTSSFESVDRARQGGLSVSAIVESLPINVRGEFNERNFRQWQQQSLQDYRLDESATESVRYFRSRANPTIVAAWEACVKREPHTGLTSFKDMIADLGLMYISWIPSPGDPTAPVITDIAISGGTVRNRSSYNVGSELLVGYRTNILLVERTSDSPVVIVVVTTKGAISETFDIIRDTQCEVCEGLRRINCLLCRGDRAVAIPNAPVWMRRICMTCHGAGDIVCTGCEGSGLYRRA